MYSRPLCVTKYFHIDFYSPQEEQGGQNDEQDDEQGALERMF
jgi:hypothetical protein